MPAVQAAREDAFVPDPEPPAPASLESGRPWTEERLILPPWPRDADLVAFVPEGPPSALRYFIDTASLRVGADGVVRFTLAAAGAGGARNLSHEGLRCTPQGAYRVYAYGLNGRFETLPASDWQPLSHQPADAWRETLWRFHFCIPRAFAPRPVPDMIRSLQGRSAPLQNSGFQAD